MKRKEENMDSQLEEMKSILKKHGQEHLLSHYEKLDEAKQKKLLTQIETIDFELMDNLYNKTKKETQSKKDKITPINYLDKSKLYDDYKHYENIGKKAIQQGNLAAVTMAGGQGTRLRT